MCITGQNKMNKPTLFFENIGPVQVVKFFKRNTAEDALFILAEQGLKFHRSYEHCLSKPTQKVL